jgi:hypothetical protein
MIIYLCILIYIHIFSERENKIALMFEGTMGGQRGKENVRE